MITSNQNPLIKLLHSLRGNHGREKTGLFLLEGVRLVESALDAGAPIRYAVYSPYLRNNQRGMACLQRLNADGRCQPQLIDDRLLCVLAGTERPQGLLVAAEQPPASSAVDPASLSRLLIVDGVQDPGNLGTIIRTADALGAEMVVTLPGTVDAYNDKAMRSAMGSIFHLCLRQHSTLETALSLVRQAGLQLVATSLNDAIPYDRAAYSARVALVVGNEGAGVSAELLQAADLRVIIPILGRAESLNVAVATGIILAELAKR